MSNCHNDIQGLTANLLTKVCYEVTFEPHFQPILVIKVFNPHAPTNHTTSASTIYRKHELCKKCSYEACLREVEQSSFTPLIFSAG